MTVMSGSLYMALKEAGATEDASRKAAEEVAAYDNKFAAVEGKLIGLEGKVTLLQWMVTFNLAMTVTILFKLFS